MKDEIIEQVRKAKAEVAQEIGGKAFENYLEYFQKIRMENEKKGFKHVLPFEVIHRKQTVRELSHEAMEFVKSQSETNREDTKDAKENNIKKS